MFTFQRAERLKSRKTIGKLFKEGHSIISYPVRFVWIKVETPLGEFPVQMALSVPKRSFPKAVDRNRLRRKIREAYRLHKHSLYQELDSQEQQFALMVIYVAKETLTFQEIEKGVKKGFGKMMRKLN